MSNLRKATNLTISEDVKRAAAKLAASRDMSLARLAERLLAAECRKAGLLTKPKLLKA